MINITKETVNDVPLLHIVQASNQNAKLPFILFLHGFTSAKEHNLHYAYLYAEKGFRVVLPEAPGHGERDTGLNESELMYRFWHIVMQLIEEAGTIKNFYVAKGLADEERIGLVGTSMGGIAAFGAITQYNWIKTAVSLMGCPQYERLARAQIAHLKENNVQLPFSDLELEEQFKLVRPYDVSNQTEKLRRMPLLFWHGIKDPLVPYQLAHEFYESIQDEYKGREDRLCFITDPQAGHKVSRKGVLESVKWFEKWL
jgi:fermentation-respiration switch protein FrsA (DUF1100 family)